MSEGRPGLFDERGNPPLRARIGQLLATADEAVFAVGRIRLGVLDLAEWELASLQSCRVLLGHLDASTLLDAADDDGPTRAPRLGPLLRFAATGRLEVRSAGVGSWSPDFAVVSAAGRRVGLVGAIYFGRPDLVIGPALTVPIVEPAETSLLVARFDDLWQRAHDVLPAVRDVLERAHELEDASGRPGRGQHPGQPVQ